MWSLAYRRGIWRARGFGGGPGRVDPGPAGAYFDQTLGEFLLPYDAVRRQADPEATLLAFLDSTYRAAADLGSWDRAALEAPLGEKLRPRPLPPLQDG